MENYQFIDVDSLVSDLQEVLGPKFPLARDHLFERPELWASIAPIGLERCRELLNTALQHWKPSLKVNKLALLMHQLSGKAMVHGDSQPYRDTFLYALSLVWNVDSVVTLADTLAEAAFNLATRANGGTKTVNQPKAGDELNEFNNDEDEVVTLPYDSPTIELPLWFEEAWNRSRDPDGERFDLRKVLEELPIVAQIPRKAYDNNHNADGKGYLDKSVKSWQQKLLHALRMLGHLSISEGGEDSYVSLLHVFHLLAELEQSLCDFRKTQSVKGSVAHSNQLFTKEELANANLAAKIIDNRLSSKGSSKGSRGKGKGFQSWGNFRQYGKGKAYGRGYGRGSYSSYPQSSTPSAHSGPRGQGSQ